MSVPTIAHVVPGAMVSIVLKADQRTGRQVQGVVQDLLTRGNHPRGIKVRLQDGRIGRVQGLASSSTASSSGANAASAQPQQHQSTESEIQRDLAIQRRTRGDDDGPMSDRGRRIHQFSRFQATDIRLDEEAEKPVDSLDLMAYVKAPTSKQKKRQLQHRQRAASCDPPPAAAISCPVCGNFKGDEAAVAHHVETHFT